MYDFYLVNKGDTIDSIASKYGTTGDVIRMLNPNSDFSVGTNVIVPKVDQHFYVYNILQGDTLYNMAKNYNTDYNLLALLNGLNVSDYIYPNTMILVPKKDVKYYITKENDTLGFVNRMLGGDVKKLLSENNNIYLKEGQLFVYKD